MSDLEKLREQIAERKKGNIMFGQCYIGQKAEEDNDILFMIDRMIAEKKEKKRLVMSWAYAILVIIGLLAIIFACIRYEVVLKIVFVAIIAAGIISLGRFLATIIYNTIK